MYTWERPVTQIGSLLIWKECISSTLSSERNSFSNLLQGRRTETRQGKRYLQRGAAEAVQQNAGGHPGRPQSLLRELRSGGLNPTPARDGHLWLNSQGAYFTRSLDSSDVSRTPFGFLGHCLDPGMFTSHPWCGSLGVHRPFLEQLDLKLGLH